MILIFIKIKKKITWHDYLTAYFKALIKFLDSVLIIQLFSNWIEYVNTKFRIRKKYMLISEFRLGLRFFPNEINKNY